MYDKQNPGVDWNTEIEMNEIKMKEKEKMEIKEFLKSVFGDPMAVKLLKSRKEPANAAEAAEQYSEMAKELGLSVSKEELESFLNKKEALQKKLAEKAKAVVKEEVSVDSLDGVAGGGVCEDTYSSGEWCWFTDSCSAVITDYTGAPDPEGEKYEPEFGDYVLKDWQVIENCEKAQITQDPDYEDTLW